MVLDRDLGQDVSHCVGIDAVLFGVSRRHHGEHRGRGQRPLRPVHRWVLSVEPLVAGVLDLLDTDSHGDVVGTRRHGVGGGSQRLGAGGAVVLDPCHRLVVDLERTRQGDAAHAALGGAEPVGVDIVLGRTRICEALGRGLDDEIVEALVPLLGERRAAHRHDGDTIFDAMACHQASSVLVADRMGRPFQK